MREIRPRKLKLMLIRAGRVTLGSRNALWESATRYAMPSLEQRLDISAPPATVWTSSHVLPPKLAPDMISNEAESQGLATVGQKNHAVG